MSNFIFLFHEFSHQSFDIFDGNSDYFVRVFGGMFGGGFFSIFLWSVVGIIGPYLFLFLVFCSKFEGWFGGCTFVLHFIFFW